MINKNDQNDNIKATNELTYQLCDVQKSKVLDVFHKNIKIVIAHIFKSFSKDQAHHAIKSAYLILHEATIMDYELFYKKINEYEKISFNCVNTKKASLILARRLGLEDLPDNKIDYNFKYISLALARFTDLRRMPKPMVIDLKLYEMKEMLTLEQIKSYDHAKIIETINIVNENNKDVNQSDYLSILEQYDQDMIIKIGEQLIWEDIARSTFVFNSSILNKFFVAFYRLAINKIKDNSLIRPEIDEIVDRFDPARANNYAGKVGIFEQIET